MFCITCHAHEHPAIPGLIMHDTYCPGQAFPESHVIGAPRED